METTIIQHNIGKNARIATNALFFLCGISFASWASRIPDMKELLHLSDAALGTVLFAMPIGSLTALPIAGVIIHKFGSKKITLFAVFFYFISLPLLGLSASPINLGISLFIFGFGSDLLNIAMNVQAVGVEKLQKRSIMSSFHAVFSIGFMLGAALGGIIAKQGISTFQHLATIGSIDLLIGLISFSYLLQHDHKSDENQPLFAIPDKSLIILGIICFCGMLCEGAMADWSVLYYKQIMDNPNGFATAGFTAFSVLMVVGRIFGDKILQALGLRKTLLINCLLVFVGMSIAIFIPSPFTVIIGFGITGLGLSTIVPLIYSEAGHSKTMAAGVALAAISTLGIAGFLIGPVMIGYLSEFFSLKIALASLIILGLLGSFLTTKIPE
ncbi:MULTISPECIES: MFS transporter [unclassified Arcicella]|uniref:MFS transporter n=1 Tax=unclassified Arcicella TaxID=2644986 RepID=UPI0028620CDA|nr:MULTISPECIES: MFS transporter [unclassified Arcicella]MDR6562554.1 MFS family permease [Arcicella sp. BE51]MDR6812641.1 MFS family permease [Arcicella sp. BE140]MDR6823953.1 MFS family permease [Arcicella sp. BE139]